MYLKLLWRMWQIECERTTFIKFHFPLISCLLKHIGMVKSEMILYSVDLKLVLIDLILFDGLSACLILCGGCDTEMWTDNLQKIPVDLNDNITDEARTVVFVIYHKIPIWNWWHKHILYNDGTLNTFVDKRFHGSFLPNSWTCTCTYYLLAMEPCGKRLILKIQIQI